MSPSKNSRGLRLLIIPILILATVPFSAGHQAEFNITSVQYDPWCAQPRQISPCQRYFNQGFRAGLNTGLRIRVEGAEWLLDALENTSDQDNDGDDSEEPEPRWFDDYPEEERSNGETTSPETGEPRWFYEYNTTPNP